MTQAPDGFDGERRARLLAPPGVLLAALGILAGGWGGPFLVAAGLALLVLAATSATEGVLLLGPFALAELRAAARRGRVWRWRAAYVLLCGLTLYLSVFLPRAVGRGPMPSPSVFTQGFFLGVAGGLAAYLTHLTLSVVAPVAAEEREKKRWEMLLTTDLRNREVLFGKVAGRLGGSENKARFAVLNPADSVADWVVETVATLGAGWCPPGVLGIGVGGTSEKAMLLAKEALMEPLDMSTIRRRGAADKLEAMRLDICDRVNRLGIGAQGLGGATTVLDVKIRTFPTHAASMPVALIPNCAANRHVHFTLDGAGPATFTPPDMADWPTPIAARASNAMTHANLDTLSRAEIAQWKPGQRLLLSGKLLTGRDAAHKRMSDMLARGEPLPVSLQDRMIYYVGPVDAVRDEAVGPAGPTTANRMDRYTETMLSQTGLIGMIGKAERGDETRTAIARHGAAYLIAVGGAGYLISKAIKASKVVAFADLGMEAIHEFRVEEMPVIVAIDARGASIHESGPAAWRQRQARQA